MNMDKSWMMLPRNSKAYKKGLQIFPDFAFSNTTIDGMVLCPCKVCKNGICLPREDVEVHLRCQGFIKGYTQWIAHGERSHFDTVITSSTSVPSNVDDMAELLNDAFGFQNGNIDIENNTDVVVEEPNLEAKKFYKLFDESQQQLWPGCKKFSKLSFLVRLLHLKCLGKMSNKIFTMLLELLNEAFPEGVGLPKTYYEAKKVIEELGLGYKKYDACPNDCTLYWGKDARRIDCETCRCTRWVTSEDDSTGEKRKVPHKVLWHFPLKTRLQRLFMSSKTASFMKWHVEGRTKDGHMRHPADSPAWQYFDFKHPEFSKDPRNIRLGLASDGFNPFKNMSVAHSTWPVIMLPYNLPPWMCMKQSYFMLSLLIPGPSAPGNNIDIYLQPLIAELKDLWDEGLDTYDASCKKNFKMRAALLWTISDFPGYATLSGWSTKGELACPVCHKNTESRWLKHSGKHCYMGHRRFLESHHPFRNDARSFDGNQDHRCPPSRVTGSTILVDLDGFEIKFGKLVSGNPKLPFNWKKKSIFFDLPYWRENLLPHNLDVMHITKNVCESLVGTLMNTNEKTKDHLKSRCDLQEMSIRPDLHPVEDDLGRIFLPHACFTLDKKEKEIFCNTLKRVKVPDGYASNISRCVQPKPLKISGLKSHDYHILMQQLLPLALRKTLSKSVRTPLIKLSRYFRELCSKVLKPQELVRMEKDIALILCQLEKLFPPSFFDVMVHLSVHLAAEAKIASPVHYRWMYPIERYLCTLKSYVRNRSRPEGSIAEGYLAEECLTFCSLYFAEGVETRFNRSSRNDEGVDLNATRIDVFAMPGRHLGHGDAKPLSDDTLRKAHQYVLFNCDPVRPFIDEHFEIVKKEHPHSSRHEVERIHSELFACWFAEKVKDLELSTGDLVLKDLKLLARGPNFVGAHYKRFLVNGFRFHTKDLEAKRKTQNSGVIVNATISSFSSTKDQNPIFGDMAYYGVLKSIVELDYTSDRKVVLFECDWVSNGRRLKQDEDGFTLVNFTNVKPHNEPFILASQAKQVFYIEDPIAKGWHVAVVSNARDVYDMDTVENIDMYLQSEVCNIQVDEVSEDISWVREGAPGFTIEASNV